MKLKLTQPGEIKVLKLTGEPAAEEDQAIANEIGEHFTGRGTRVVLDLSEANYLNSDCLGQLVRAAAQANLQESRLVLAAPTAFVAGALQMTRLDRFFEVFPTVAEALTKLR